jgi:hypothetical protein
MERAVTTKREELAANARGEGCLGKSQDDEPVFVLVARDRIAADIVRDWAYKFLDLRTRTNSFDAEASAKYDDALRLAGAMEAWRDAHGGGKVPD